MKLPVSCAITTLPRTASKSFRHYANTVCLLTTLTRGPLQHPVAASGLPPPLPGRLPAALPGESWWRGPAAPCHRPPWRHLARPPAGQRRAGGNEPAMA